MSEIAFIDVQPRRADTGAEVTVRLAGGGTDTPYRRNGENYHAGVVAMPRFRAAFGFDDNGWTGGTVPTNGEIGFVPGASSLMTELLGYYWRDAAVTIDAGEEGGALVRRLTGTVADVVVNEGQLQLTIADPSQLLDKPLLGAGFTGEGGIEGASEATGRPKRRSWGRVYNVEGGLLDKANNIYEFGDPSKPIGAFDAVRDKGRAGAIVELPWQGSVAATFTALQAADAPDGGCVAAPSIACVKWWTVPAGPLTADIRGENSGGYSETAAGIVAKMLAAVGGPALADLAAAEALRPAPCGVHIAVGTDTVAQAIDRLLLGVSLYWVLQPDATIRIGEWAWGAPVAAFQAIFLGRERQLPPVKTRKVGYRRNHRVHSDSEISAAVILADDVSYLDGTPLEDLKPAEGGAQQNRPPSTTAPTPPLDLPEGTIWFAPDGHPYRFGRRPWVGAEGNAWIGADGEPWLGSGYEDVQDQLGVQAMAAAEAVTAEVARIASDGWLTAGEKSGLVLSHKAMIENHIALDAKAAALGVAATERTNATNAVNALNAYLTSLSPAWNDTTQDSEAAAATITGLWGDAAQKVALLQAAVQGLPGPQGDPGTNGTDGIDGADGKLVEFVWKRAASQPAAPSGNGIPAGWSDDPPAGSDPLWMSKAKQELDGTLVAGETWSTPIRHDGTPGAQGLPGISPVSAVAVPASKQFTADSGGVVKAGQLPFNFAIDAIKAGEPIGGTVSVVSVSGCTATAISGGFTIDTISADAGFVQWKIVATDGQEVIGKVSFSRQRDPASGGSVSVNFSSTSWWGDGSYAASGPTTVLPASSIGKLRISGYASFYSAANGTATLTAKLQYRAVGSGTWIDSGFSATGNAFKSPDLEGEPGENSPGDVFPNGELTGLTADAPYEIQLVGNRSTSGTAIASATGFVSMTQVLT